MISFANNQVSQWLDSKSIKQKQDLFKTNILQAKQMQLERMRQKKLKEKEQLTENIVAYGLWQSREQVDDKLSTLKTKKEKVKALKVQLDFREKVLHAKIFVLPNILSIYVPVEVICANLHKLLSSAH